MNIITKTAELKNALAPLHQADFITLDTEFIRESTFYPELCLVQIAGPDSEFAIDALSKELDLSALFDILLDENVLKVIHSGRQDLEIFYYLMDKLPKNVFDTQIAAMVCGFGESVSYENLVINLTEHRLDKSQQSSNWKRRPLTEKQIAYAISDVTHLREIYQKLYDKIVKLNRMSWLKEENAWLLDESLYRFNPDTAAAKFRPRRQDPLSMYLLRELAGWRELEARKRNIPKRRVLMDDALMEFAAFKPKDVNELKSNRTLRNFHKNPLAETLVTFVQGLIEAAPHFDPKPKMHQQKYNNAELEIIKLLLKLVGEQEKVAPKLIANADELKKLVSKDYTTESELACLSGWRREIFGEKALKLLKGEITFGLHKGRIKFFELN